MPPREMILSATPLRMSKLAEYGQTVPLKIRGGGHEYHAVMVNPYHQGSGLNLAGSGWGKGTLKKLEKGSKVGAAVAAPVVGAANPAAGAALGVYAATPTISGSGKKAKRAKASINQAAQLGALMGQSTGMMTPEQAQLLAMAGNVVQGSGKKDKRRMKTAGSVAKTGARLGAAVARSTGNSKADKVAAALDILAGAGINLAGGALDITSNTPMPEYDPAPLTTKKSLSKPRFAVVG